MIFVQGTVFEQEVKVAAGRFSTMAAAVSSCAGGPEIAAAFSAASLANVLVDEQHRAIEFCFDIPRFVPYEWTAIIAHHLHQQFIPQAATATFRASFAQPLALREIVERDEAWEYVRARFARELPSLLGWLDVSKKQVHANTITICAHPTGVHYLTERKFPSLFGDLVRAIFHIAIKTEVRAE